MPGEKKKKSDFSKDVKKAKNIGKQNPLLIKNGILYFISRDSDKKTRKRTTEYFRNKRWLVKDVCLHTIEINDETIEKVIKAAENPENEKLAYSRVYDMPLGNHYILGLSDMGFNTFIAFLESNDIKQKEMFCLRRIGKGFGTRMTFMKPTKAKK